MGTDTVEVVETPSYSYPSAFKVHHMMCMELRKHVDRVLRIFREIEDARPRCSSGLKILCSLNNAIEKEKLLLQYCSESSNNIRCHSFKMSKSKELVGTRFMPDSEYGSS